MIYINRQLALCIVKTMRFLLQPLLHFEHCKVPEMSYTMSTSVDFRMPYGT